TMRWRDPGRRVRGAVRVATLALVLVAALDCRQQTPVQAPRPTLRIANAFLPLTQPLTAEYRRTLKNVDVQAVNTPTSINVIRAIADRTADFGVAYSDDTYAGYWEQEGKKGAREIRGVAVLQPLAEYLLVRGNSGIRQMTDLNGRVIGVGPNDSSSSKLGRQVIEAFDVHPAAIRVFANRADAAAALDGTT